MNRLHLILMSSLFIGCCHESDDFKFNSKDKLKVREQLIVFIEDLHARGNVANKYRDYNIKWWNADDNGMIKGNGKVIPVDVSLHQIRHLQNLKIDSLVIINNTIQGLVNYERINCPDGAIMIDSISKNKISLLISQEGKICGIINKPILSIACFYMDESEINSNEYRQWEPPKWTKKQIDSMESHRNDFQLISSK